jgi:hypothetical protein
MPSSPAIDVSTAPIAADLASREGRRRPRLFRLDGDGALRRLSEATEEFDLLCRRV